MSSLEVLDDLGRGMLEPDAKSQPNKRSRTSARRPTRSTILR